MDYNTVSAQEFGQSLAGLTINLLTRDVPALASFLTDVFGMQAHRTSRDFAIMRYAGQVLQLHHDATYASHPLPGLLPEAGARGAGIEIRLHDTDPDAACAKAAQWPDATILQAPADKAGHGLREAVILSADGYAFVPSRHL